MGPVAAAVGGIAGGALGLIGASNASSAQTKAAKQASQTQMNMFNKVQAGLKPFEKMGVTSGNMLMQQLGTLTKPFDMTQEQLEATPGYQFTLGEGLKATQNSYAAQGLGQSGAAMKGAAQYATGLASTTFQQQLQNYLSQNMQRYNMLMGPAQLGEGAAAQTGAFGTQTAQQVGNNLIGAGNAQAAAWVGGTNAASSGINNAIMNAYQMNYANQLLGKMP